MSDCPQCGRRHTVGERTCACGYDFWRAAATEAGRSAPPGQPTVDGLRPSLAEFGLYALLAILLCASAAIVLSLPGHAGKAIVTTHQATLHPSPLAALWPPGFAASVCGALYQLQLGAGPAINDLTAAAGTLDSGDLLTAADRISRSAGSARKLLDAAQPWPAGASLLRGLIATVGLSERGANTISLGALKRDAHLVEAGNKQLLDAAASLRDATSSFVALHAATGVGC